MTQPYATIIGLEVHVQLATASKLFCRCSTQFGAAPNTQTCPVCIGLPGSLPVMNRRAFELSLQTAVALNCNIPEFTKWDRKQYFYPDLPKGYQISQFALPMSADGYLEISDSKDRFETKQIRILRAHLEEDAGKSVHDEVAGKADSEIDLNRTGTPLLEIVSEPDMRSALEARTYLQELKLLLTYIGVSDCNMQEGSLRCDANVNLELTNPAGEAVRTPIVEVKNLNSFRGVEAALTFEIARQEKEFDECDGVYLDDSKQTRGWDAQRGVTFAQRGKEDASDYRYFPDPDLLPVTFSDEYVAELRDRLCEPPAQRRSRFVEQMGLSEYDAAVLIDQGPHTADYFERVALECQDAKRAANWVTQDVLRELKERDQAIDDFSVDPQGLASLISLIIAEELTTRSGREVFAALVEGEGGEGTVPERIDRIVAERGLAAVADTDQLDQLIETVIAGNQQAADDFRDGKEAAIGKLIGEVMREAGGADPKTVREALIAKIRS